MKVTLPEFERAGVLVVGDVMLDRYWYGPTSRISPEAPVPVVKVENIEERPGGAANVAMNIASLGATSRLVGLTGIDDAARALSQALANVNVKCDFVSVPTHPTITKLRVLSRNQQLIRLDFEEGFSGVDPQPMHERIQQALGSIGALVLSDYAKGALTSVQTMIRLAREAGVPVLIDPKGTDFERYRGATLLTPNLSEFEAVVGKCQDEAQIVERGMKLIAEFELSALLVTRSEQGMTLLQPGRPPLHMPTQAQEVYDVTGAGDTVIGVLAATLASGNTLEEACYFANAAAGVVVGKLGTSTVSPVELENAVRGRAETGFGVMSDVQPGFSGLGADVLRVGFIRFLMKSVVGGFCQLFCVFQHAVPPLLFAAEAAAGTARVKTNKITKIIAAFFMLLHVSFPIARHCFIFRAALTSSAEI